MGGLSQAFGVPRSVILGQRRNPSRTLGRYSFVTANPFHMIGVVGGQVVDTEVGPYEGDPFLVLQQLSEQLAIRSGPWLAPVPRRGGRTVWLRPLPLHRTVAPAPRDEFKTPDMACWASTIGSSPSTMPSGGRGSSPRDCLRQTRIREGETMPTQKIKWLKKHLTSRRNWPYSSRRHGEQDRSWTAIFLLTALPGVFSNFDPLRLS